MDLSKNSHVTGKRKVNKLLQGTQYVIFLAIFGFIARLYRPKGKILKENRIVFSNLLRARNECFWKGPYLVLLKVFCSDFQSFVSFEAFRA
jgi:hypothetical protein